MQKKVFSKVWVFGAVWAACAVLAPCAVAQNAQAVAAQESARDGIALNELNPNAPDSHTVRRGDTLWGISKIFLKSPWNWPKLWGMNKDQIRNPNLIYPGQVLFLDKTGGRARLRSAKPIATNEGGGSGNSRVSPQVRYAETEAGAVASIADSVIRPFLNQAIMVDGAAFALAPRIVGLQEASRVLLANGDRAYARASNAEDLSMAADAPRSYRVYRNANPLKDPDTGEILAYEAYYLGLAELVRPEGVREKRATDQGGNWYDWATVLGKNFNWENVYGKNYSLRIPGSYPDTPNYRDGALVALNAKKTMNNESDVAPVAAASIKDDGMTTVEEMKGENIEPSDAAVVNTEPVQAEPTSTSPIQTTTADAQASVATDKNATPRNYEEALASGRYEIVPATLDIQSVREEIRVGDRLAPDQDINNPPSYIPHPVPTGLRARVVSLYEGAVDNAGQNQIITINKGSRDGIEPGHVMSLVSQGRHIKDRTDTNLDTIYLPNEANGNIMIFRAFDRVSYALILDIRTPVRVGDYLIQATQAETPIIPRQ